MKEQCGWLVRLGVTCGKEAVHAVQCDCGGLFGYLCDDHAGTMRHVIQEPPIIKLVAPHS